MGEKEENSFAKTFTTAEKIQIFGDEQTFMKIIKRMLDIFAAIIGLFVLLPLLLAIGIGIKIDSPGPVIYLGKRMGRNMHPFEMAKFRTMYDLPSSFNGNPVTAQGDPRITRMGHFLRDTKLNELPQLWNVLRGEMSLVGPRPEDVEIALRWPEELQKEILSVRPGITSPASVIYRNEEALLHGSGFLDDYLQTILPDKLRLDQLYVRNMNLMTDLDVLSMTLVSLLPAIRSRTIDERWFYGGAFFTFYNRVLKYFFADIFVTALAVGVSGIVWRISAVINLGAPVYLALALAIAVLTSLLNAIFGLTKVEWSNASPVYVIDLAFTTSLTMAIIWVINRYWLTEPWIPFSMLWLMGLTIFIGLVGIRYRSRIITGVANRWLLLRGPKAAFAERILIVGAGNLSEMTLWLLERSSYASLFGVIGLVDDDPRKQSHEISGVRVLGKTSDIPALVKKYQIGVIFFAISNCSPLKQSELIALCEQTGAKVVLIPDLVKTLERSIKEIEISEP